MWLLQPKIDEKRLTWVSNDEIDGCIDCQPGGMLIPDEIIIHIAGVRPLPDTFPCRPIAVPYPCFIITITGRRRCRKISMGKSATTQMPFAEMSRGIPRLAKQRRQSICDGVRKPVRHATFSVFGITREMTMYPVSCRKMTGNHGCATGRTNTARYMKPGEKQTFLCEPIQNRCLNGSVPVYAKVAKAPVIGTYEQHIQSVSACLYGILTHRQYRKQHHQL